MSCVVPERLVVETEVKKARSLIDALKVHYPADDPRVAIVETQQRALEAILGVLRSLPFSGGRS